MAHHQLQPSSTKVVVERKIAEKNRRNHMNDLCSKLHSLLPSNNPAPSSLSLHSAQGSGALSRADQIEGAINYIKSLETKVKMAQEKKESLMERKNKRSRSREGWSSTKFEIHESGSSLQITLMCGFDNQFIFNEIIRILHENNVEVKSAHSSSVDENSMLHVIHAQIQQSFQAAGITTIGDRLKRFVDGHCEDFLAA
ncbi:hypothetical protein RJT34_28934 [Clitoria ternatea]|uniref:BHLH domain-containing protein n=1 Tax=Clitoria ternatea TaxID=43366 RepID=A0AAN9FEN7_CLITE